MTLKEFKRGRLPTFAIKWRSADRAMLISHKIIAVGGMVKGSSYPFGHSLLAMT